MERIWLKNYPHSIPADITDQLDQYSSLAAMLDYILKRYARNTAYISMGSRISYAELDRKSRQFAGWLQSIGVKRGDRVVLMMPNLIQYPICLIGTIRAGAAVVNTNPLYTANELRHQLKDSGAKVIVIAENFAHTLQEALPDTDIETIVVTSVGEMLGGMKGKAVDLVVKHVKKLVPAWSIPQAKRLGKVLQDGEKTGFSKPELNHDDIAFLQYTGGTTGVAKGAMLTHGNMVANILQAHAWIAPYVRIEKECIITALPLYHIFALTANCLTFMFIGASNLLILNPRDIPAFIKSLRRTPFTAITGVNTLFNALLNHPKFSKVDFSHLRVSLGGGMAVQEVVATRWLKTTSVPIAQAYGLTETSPAVTINPLDTKEFTGSIGMPVSSTEIAIRDGEGKDVPQGENGEICVRGPQVSPGYWNNPEETRKAFHPDGFFMTGDIGYVDDRGYLYILDRKKDTIIVSGFNVYPNEVEAAATRHPDVIEAAAVGVPDEHSGEAVKLFVIRRNDRLTEDELIQHCRKLLTGYKRPKYVEFRSDLPRTNVGKVLRRELR